MRCSEVVVPCMLLIGSAGMLRCQDVPSGSDTDGLPGASSPAWTSSQTSLPLTLGQKYLYTASEVAGPGALFSVGFHALLDEGMNRPAQWGTGEGSYDVRAASIFGRSFLRQNIAFGVRALDHEDPRYFRSGQGSGWSRIRYATIHTFLVHNDNGSLMPAYSLFVAGATMPFIAQSWSPQEFSAARGFRGATAVVSGAIAADLWYEFWPDLRQKLPRLFRKNRRLSWFNAPPVIQAASEN